MTPEETIWVTTESLWRPPEGWVRPTTTEHVKELIELVEDRLNDGEDPRSVLVEQWGPIRVLRVTVKGGPRYLLIDGGHRAEAAQLLGLEEIPAELSDARSMEEARREAIECSNSVYRPLTRAQQAENIQWLLDNSNDSDAEIAAAIGCSRATVWRHRNRTPETTGTKKPIGASERQAETIIKCVSKVEDDCSEWLNERVGRDRMIKHAAEAAANRFGNEAPEVLMWHAEALRDMGEQARLLLAKSA